MTIVQAIVIGIVQGLTEFLPVSSTAHLILVPHFLGWKDPGLDFDLALHLGTLLAVASYFRSDLVSVIRGGLRTFRRPDIRGDREQKLAWMLVLGTIPAAAVGIPLKHQIETAFRSPLVIAYALLGVAAVILLAEIVGKRARGVAAAGYRDAGIVGLGQAFAVIPGVSRSGSSIAAGLFAGLSREAAARLSFLIGLPTIFGACLLAAKDVVEAGGFARVDWVPVVAGTLASAVVGYACIAWLLGYVQRRSFAVFIAYRMLLGLLLLYLAYFGGFQ